LTKRSLGQLVLVPGSQFRVLEVGMNSIIYIVGLVVIVIAILSFLGLR